ncbi:hypothetical protein CAOG_009777 [Capsaspora owczarzaki ATCC 30864]|uniref:Uncharacterized protein n=1 Tax=Capsaspora owczarzaki (strain ATCC 30864) TaxID=595528 RepID=A0A0D2WRE7_CAPO3|nr:hypothetical protein CAOG_009777 [Capsaspora owczarzaki ATCC 30864]
MWCDLDSATVLEVFVLVDLTVDVCTGGGFGVIMRVPMIEPAEAPLATFSVTTRASGMSSGSTFTITLMGLISVGIHDAMGFLALTSSARWRSRSASCTSSSRRCISAAARSVPSWWRWMSCSAYSRFFCCKSTSAFACARSASFCRTSLCLSERWRSSSCSSVRSFSRSSSNSFSLA